MSTLATRTFTQAFTESRSHLNDSVGDVYSDAVLLPFGASAYRDVQRAFSDAGIPQVETVNTSLEYIASAETIDLSSIPDLMAPLELWEQGDGTDGGWIQMRRVTDLRPPYIEEASILGCWEWLNGAIRVLPCSEDRDIFIRYRRGLAYPTAGLAVGFDEFYDPIVYGTALKAAAPTGLSYLLPGLRADYKEQLRSAIHTASRDRQGITFRQQGRNENYGDNRVNIAQN